MPGPDHRIVADLLKSLRLKAGLTQTELAQRLGVTQSAVSKLETAELGLDVLEARAFCLAVGVDFGEFVRRLEHRLSGEPDEG